MNRRFLLVVLFMTIVFAGDRLISFLSKMVISQSKNQFARMYEGKYRADVLFMGDSRVDRNFNFAKITELTGDICLNLGLGGNSVLVSEVLLKDYVERYGKPRMVLIELSQTLTNPDMIGEIRIFSYHSPKVANLARELDPTYTAFESVFKSLLFNSPAFWRLATEVVTKPRSRMLRNTIPPEKIGKWAKVNNFKRPIFRKNMQALDRICDYADSLGIGLALLVCPSWKEYLSAITNYSEWMEELMRSVGMHPIRDYSRLFIDKPEFFNDEIHLNVRGATRFVEILVADGLLTSLR